jgi:hypothetical protein
MSKEKINSEEVDLGSLFQVIGKGFKNLFNAIGNFFKAIFHYLIQFLLFLRNNAIKLAIAAFIGTIIGLYLDLTKPSVYSSTMIVEPNFNSTQQLYKNLTYYNELVKQKNTALLSESFNISTEEASKLIGFYIEPIKNENEKYELYDKFIQNADTAVAKSISIVEFKKGFSGFDYRYHEIKVRSLNGLIFDKLSNKIINSIEDNPYYKNQRVISTQNLLQNEKVLLKSLAEIDTLRKIYNEVLLTEAKKMESGTNITLAQGVKKTEEVELFHESLKLNEELINNNKEKAESSEILNIVSAFSKLGVKERTIYKKYTFQFAALFFGLMLIFILLKQLNSYLGNYKLIDFKA